MQKKILLTGFLSAFAALCFTSPSNAAIITFDGVGLNTVKPVVVDGFEFDYIDENGWCICDVNVSSAEISNGTDQILIRDTGDRDSTISMVVAGGGVFSLQSFLGADGLLGIGGRSIEVTGFLFGGGSIVESFLTIADTQSSYSLSAAFTNLIRVEFHSFGDRGDGLTLDNIEVNRAAVEVPEPATLALFGMGLVGLGMAGRRRKAK